MNLKRKLLIYLPKLLPDSSKSSESTTKSAISNGTIQTQTSNIDINKISRDTESSLNKLDTILIRKKLKNVKLTLDYLQKMLLNNFIIGKLKLKKKKLQKHLLMM